ncbi:MAG: SET domain-containing protein-lysine N-methyltransferase [Microgenomates group bacterium]
MDIPVYISTSKELNGIRCVKAARDIKAGELIEECPVILLSYAELEHTDKTIITNYNYDWDDKNDALVLGYCGLTNHSFTANARYESDFKKKCMLYFAVKDIKKDEEVFINYNGKPEDTTPLEYSYHTNYKY